MSSQIQRTDWFLPKVGMGSLFQWEGSTVISHISQRKSLRPRKFQSLSKCSSVLHTHSVGLPWCLSSKETPIGRKRGLESWVEKILWRRKRQPTPIFLPGKSDRGAGRLQLQKSRASSEKEGGAGVRNWDSSEKLITYL